MSNVPDESYAAYADAPAAGEGLAELAKMADLQASAEAEVAAAEATLNAAKEKLKHISEVQVPALMDQLGLSEFKTTAGLTIKINEIIRASIPSARTEEAFAWLRSHGHAALIKRKLALAFGMGEDQLAEEWISYIKQRGFDDLEDQTAVHPATLASFVKTKLEAGENLPLELFGVFRQRVSKIETPKVKKAKK